MGRDGEGWGVEREKGREKGFGIREKEKEKEKEKGGEKESQEKGMFPKLQSNFSFLVLPVSNYLDRGEPQRGHPSPPSLDVA